MGIALVRDAQVQDSEVGPKTYVVYRYNKDLS